MSYLHFSFTCLFLLLFVILVNLLENYGLSYCIFKKYAFQAVNILYILPKKILSGLFIFKNIFLS